MHATAQAIKSQLGWYKIINFVENSDGRKNIVFPPKSKIKINLIRDSKPVFPESPFFYILPMFV